MNRASAGAATLALLPLLSACGVSGWDRISGGAAVGAAAGAGAGAAGGPVGAGVGAAVGAGTGAVTSVVTSARDLNLGRPPWSARRRPAGAAPARRGPAPPREGLQDAAGAPPP